jgi:restriction system protein
MVDGPEKQPTASVEAAHDEPPGPALDPRMLPIYASWEMPAQTHPSGYARISLPAAVLASSGATEPPPGALEGLPANLLLQTVIVPGAKTDEGKLILSVAYPWFDIIDLMARNPNIAYELSPEKWEEIIAGAYKKAGFEEVTLTPRSGDLGRDVIATKRGFGFIRVIAQVKAYHPGLLVTADDVRALLGVLQGDGASKGVLTTTSDFAPRLTKDILLAPFIPSRLELINGKMLLVQLQELARQGST